LEIGVWGRAYFMWGSQDIYIYYTEYVGISLFVMITIFQMNRIAEICLSQDLFILPKRNAHI
jgi:hypothetical protein